MFNIAPRTGFERDRQCDLVIMAGNFYQTDDQISCGGHTRHLRITPASTATAAITGCRRRSRRSTTMLKRLRRIRVLYLQPRFQEPVSVVGSLRQDYYQIPIDPDPNSSVIRFWQSSGLVPSYGLHDAEREPDAYAIFSWVHTFNPTTLLTLSPFYHYNAANYQGGPNDYPVITNVNLAANYVGFQGILNKSFWRNDLEAGVVRVLPAPVQLFPQRIHGRYA